MSLNKVLLIGNLGQEPDFVVTDSKLSLCSMRIATNETRRDSNGARLSDTQWHTVVVFGRLAIHCARFLRMGSKVFVEGKLVEREYVDRTGKPRSRTEVVSQHVVFLDGNSNTTAEAVLEVGFSVDAGSQ